MGHLRPPMPCEGCGRPIAQALPICPLCGHRRAGFVPKELPPEPVVKKVDAPRELPREARAQVLLLAHAEAAKSVETVRKLGLAEKILTVLVWPAIAIGMVTLFPFLRRLGKLDSFWVVASGVLALAYLGLRAGGLWAVLCAIPIVAWVARAVVRAIARANDARLV